MGRGLWDSGGWRFLGRRAGFWKGGGGDFLSVGEVLGEGLGEVRVFSGRR